MPKKIFFRQKTGWLTSITLFIFILITCTGASAKKSSCIIPEIYSDPLNIIGKTVECRADVEKIISVSMPISMVLETDGFLWYAENYEPKNVVNVPMKEGKTVTINGSYLSKKKIMFNGSIVELPMVIVNHMEVE